MLHIHPNARTTPATRAEIARSTEPSGSVARRYGISAETVRKWRKRGAADCLDRSARPHQLPWKATQEERAIVCILRRATNFPLDDLTFVVSHFLPHLNRDSVWRILKAEGLNCRAKPLSEQPAKGQGTFRDYDLGFVHIDVKHLPPQPFHPLRGWNLGLLRQNCRPATVTAANAFCSSPSTAARAPSTSRSKTTRPRKVPSPSCTRPPPPSRSGSPMC
jgi:transposase